MLKKGTKCVKTSGREKGKNVRIVEVIDENFVLVEGDGVKKRRCNVKHLKC